MIKVPLSQGYVALIDDEDEELTRFKWSAHKERNAVYAVRSYPRPGRSKGIERMHVTILARTLGTIAFEQCDHVDGNGLNNCRNNLRPATHAQNRRNIGLPKDNTSGVLGVAWDKRTQQWRAQIGSYGKCVFLGRYDDIHDAIAARQRAEQELWGEFAPSVSRP